jgi:hypothetical protein
VIDSAGLMLGLKWGAIITFGFIGFLVLIFWFLEVLKYFTNALYEEEKSTHVNDAGYERFYLACLTGSFLSYFGAFVLSITNLDFDIFIIWYTSSIVILVVWKKLVVSPYTFKIRLWEIINMFLIFVIAGWPMVILYKNDFNWGANFGRWTGFHVSFVCIFSLIFYQVVVKKMMEVFGGDLSFIRKFFNPPERKTSPQVYSQPESASRSHSTFSKEEPMKKPSASSFQPINNPSTGVKNPSSEPSINNKTPKPADGEDVSFHNGVCISVEQGGGNTVSIKWQNNRNPDDGESILLGFRRKGGHAPLRYNREDNEDVNGIRIFSEKEKSGEVIDGKDFEKPLLPSHAYYYRFMVQENNPDYKKETKRWKLPLIGIELMVEEPVNPDKEFIMIAIKDIAITLCSDDKVEDLKGKKTARYFGSIDIGIQGEEVDDETILIRKETAKYKAEIERKAVQKRLNPERQKKGGSGKQKTSKELRDELLEEWRTEREKIQRQLLEDDLLQKNYEEEDRRLKSYFYEEIYALKDQKPPTYAPRTRYEKEGKILGKKV